MGASQLYSWDEVGRLVRARRWDQASVPAGLGSPVVDLQYHYAAGDSRVLKTARDPGGQEVHTAYVFPSLELRRAEFDTDSPGDYTLDSSTEVAYLFANGVRLARLVHQPLDSAGDGVLLRVFFELGDHLGSTSVALDKDTGELVERSTYQAYGGAESSYRPSKWGNFREDYRFTGKEEDVEVGLTYFGKRFYNALLQRWVSPDPLEVHQPGQADANLYAYVRGAALKNVDPLGLADDYSNAYTQTSDDAVDVGTSTEGGVMMSDFTQVNPSDFEDTEDGSQALGLVRVGNNEATLGDSTAERADPQNFEEELRQRTAETDPINRAAVAQTWNSLLDMVADPSASRLFGEDSLHAAITGSLQSLKMDVPACDGCEVGEQVGRAAAVTAVLIGAALRGAKSPGLANEVRWKGFSRGELARHFEKHGKEFGDITQNDYLKMAKDFAQEVGDFREQKVGNFIVKYDEVSRRTLVGHGRSREIRTFYVADGRDDDPFQAALDLARETSGL